MGNKRQFDETDVLGKLADHFWKHGYSATKVDQLSVSTGLTKTSLYNAFGNKEALFLCAINYYMDVSLSELFNSINLEKKLSENIEYIFNETFYKKKNKNVENGCLLTNSLVELKDNEQALHLHVNDLCEKVRKKKLRFISHYVDRSLISPEYNAKELTDLYMTFWQGLRVESRTNSCASKLKSSTQTFLKFIRSIEVD